MTPEDRIVQLEARLERVKRRQSWALPARSVHRLVPYLGGLVVVLLVVIVVQASLR